MLFVSTLAHPASPLQTCYGLAAAVSHVVWPSIQLKNYNIFYCFAPEHAARVHKQPKSHAPAMVLNIKGQKPSVSQPPTFNLFFA